ncbi:hypothetical protein LTS08_007265 [Lithohypha guttulata]|nr:hypothetical protein LTS08_007265 [Lithohypha guttulata]
MALWRVLWSAIITISTLQIGILAQTCDTTVQSPIVFPVRNVTVEGNRMRRGMRFSYGTPEQNVAVAISAGWNETYIYDENGQCSGLASAACTVGRGGAFNEGSSSTWTGLSSISALNSKDNVANNAGSNGLAGRDKLTINSSLSFDQFSIAIPRKSGPDYSTLGLGPSSRILDIAKNASTIASRSWSLFWGQTGLTDAHTNNGAVVLGGVDETQTTGNNFTGAIRPSVYSSCRSGMIVEVTDMVVSVPGGSSGSLLSGGVQGQGVNYCLEPEFPIITMLLDHWNEWEDIDPDAETSGNAVDRAGGGPNVWGLIYPKQNITKASLTITIAGSLEITIPNHQLVQAYYTFNEDGQMAVNNTVSELMINPLQAGNANDIPKLGMTFFQAAYLHVNYDKNQYTLWEAANPTGQNSKFAGVGGSSVGCATPSNSTSSPNNGTTSGGSSSNNNNNNNSNNDTGISGGAIGGIVAGVVVGILALAGLAFFFWRRKKQARTGPPSETATPLYDMNATQEKPELMGSYTGHSSSGFYTGKPELASNATAQPVPNWMQPQEVPANAVHRPTVEPQELPSQRYD